MYENQVLVTWLFPRKQLLIQRDAMNTKEGCHLWIIKQFLQHFLHSNEIKDN